MNKTDKLMTILGKQLLEEAEGVINYHMTRGMKVSCAPIMSPPQARRIIRMARDNEIRFEECLKQKKEVI